MVTLIDTFIQIATTLGVPTGCLAVTFYLWYTEIKSHREEVESLSEVIQNNTLALQKLIDKMGG